MEVGEAPTPCQVDWGSTRRSWWETTDTDSNLTRQGLREMAALCNGADGQPCPMREQCFRQAVKDSPHSVGVWGGRYFDRGVIVDPYGTDRGDMKSVYRRVHWDRVRKRWKASAQHNGIRHHIGYFDDEDEAGRKARAWKPPSTTRGSS